MEYNKERPVLVRKMAPIDNMKFDDILDRLNPPEYPIKKIY